MKSDETNRIEKLEQLIQSKAFRELSDSEKKFVLEEFESEEQYQAMRKLTPFLDEMYLDTAMKPKQSVLESLKDSLAMKTSTDSLWNKWFAWKVPAYATVLATGLGCLITWWMAVEPPIEITEKPSIRRTDTVYIASKPDTIFKEKVVYRFVKTIANIKPSVESSNNVTNQKNADPVGVSMKDKEELEKLLVSGSR